MQFFARDGAPKIGREKMTTRRAARKLVREHTHLPAVRSLCARHSKIGAPQHLCRVIPRLDVRDARAGEHLYREVIANRHGRSAHDLVRQGRRL